jgi:hypothetical protein
MTVILSCSKVTLTPASSRHVPRLRDRLRPARHAAVDPAPDQQADGPHAEGDQVPHRLVVELQGDQVAARGALGRVAQRAAGPVARRRDDLQDDARQRQRHQHEIVAGDAEAKARIGDDQRQRAGADQGDRNADPRRDVEVVPHQRRDIGADAHEAAMTQRHQAEAAHHRPRGVGERPDQDEDQDVDVIGIAIDERQHDQRHADDRGDEPALVHEFHWRLASSPAGRMNIIKMKKAKAST